MPKIYRYTKDQIAFNLGLQYNELSDGMLLFSHCQFPNNYPKYIAIPMVDEESEYYDLYKYTKELNYENAQNPGSYVFGPAIIHDAENIVEDAKTFRENSKRILAIMQKGKKKTEADHQSEDE